VNTRLLVIPLANFHQRFQLMKSHKRIAFDGEDRSLATASNDQIPDI
jgi:hypothetical protein